MVLDGCCKRFQLGVYSRGRWRRRNCRNTINWNNIIATNQWIYKCFGSGNLDIIEYRTSCIFDVVKPVPKGCIDLSKEAFYSNVKLYEMFENDFYYHQEHLMVKWLLCFNILTFIRCSATLLLKHHKIIGKLLHVGYESHCEFIRLICTTYVKSIS